MIDVVAGQRWVSEREPELGLGVITGTEPERIRVSFAATGEKRIYARGTTVLKRVRFRTGDRITGRDGSSLVVEHVLEEKGCLVYVGEGQRWHETELSDITSVSAPAERLLAGQADPGAVFALRLQALEARAHFRAAPVRGFLGGRIDLIPHQFSILQEVARRQIPRVLLADEVGLGKTIEACLIVQRLLAVGRARRVLILVPESLIHQWFVELLRRFNLWFSIFDEARCQALAASEAEQNPFLDAQLALASIDEVAESTTRADQLVEAGWDVVVVDEAHHLDWSPTEVSPAYALVDRLAAGSPGLLLLTATPTQHGLASHFARLRLLDPQRYDDFDRFAAETAQFAAVAGVIDRILSGEILRAEDRQRLQELFTRDPDRLAQHMQAIEQPGAAGEAARRALIRTLLDQHGTGRVMFRNTRSVVAGFPQRIFCPVPLEAEGESGDDVPDPGATGRQSGPTLRARIGRELVAEERGETESVRYAFKNDPRISWLADFLRDHRPDKVLLICRSQRKALAIGSALQEEINAKVALFHEGLPLVQRDRQAAWFAEPEGAQLMICSEIGSEGRNFQFAHHLVLFDLPLNPGLIEQRIGRLDRIGQSEDIRIHVPYVTGSAQELVVEWYHQGVGAFERPLAAGEEYVAPFRERVLELVQARDEDPAPRQQLLIETAAFRRELDQRLQEGRDRLLELNSFSPAAAQAVIDRIREVDTDPFLRRFLLGLLDHFGVRVREHEEGDVFLDPSHAYIEAFPSIPADGMLATFDRSRAITREDIAFLSPDHPLVEDAISLLLASPRGTSAFNLLRGPKPNIWLEAVYVLEAVADSRWQVDSYLPARPVRVLVDVHGNDSGDTRSTAELTADAREGDLHRFLERPGFDASLLGRLLETANVAAERRAAALMAAARERAELSLSEEVQRLADLQRVNDHVRPEEVALAQEQLQQTLAAISRARLRLDAVRLILEGPQG